MDGLVCRDCRGVLLELADGLYVCPRCETRARIPYTQDGSVYYNRPASRLKAMTFPALSIVGLFILAFGWAPVGPTILVTVFAYVFLDALVWAAGGGASKLAAIAVRMCLVAVVAGAVYLQVGA